MKLFKLLFISIIIIIPIVVSQAQRVITPQDLEKWQRITSRTISDDGKWVAITFTPWRGDSRIELYSSDGKKKNEFTPANNYNFSSSSKYFIVKKVPTLTLVDSLKLKKEKKMPMDELLIHELKTGNEWKIDSLIEYALCKSHDFIAYKRLHKDSSLIISSLDGKCKTVLSQVNNYAFAPKSATLYYVIKDTIAGNIPGLYIWQNEKNKHILIKKGKDNFSSISFNNKGNKLAFLYNDKSKDSDKSTTVWMYELGDTARMIASNTTNGIPVNWIISRNYRPWFSDDEKRIYIGTAPEPQKKDTTILAENRPNVQIWSWDEPVQYTVQQYNVNNESKRSYTAVYHIEEGKLIQIADTILPNCQLPFKGVGEWAILSTSLPYSLSSMWEGRTRSDYYKVSLKTGERTPISHADYANYRLSNDNKYAISYNPIDSCWYTVNLQNEKNQITCLTTPKTFIAWDEENDMPDYPSSYGYAGWTEYDGNVLIYDKYDIWSFHPENKREPINITKNGRTKNLRYRRIQTENDEKFIDTKKSAYFYAFSYSDKTTHIYIGSLETPQSPQKLTDGIYRYNNFIKSKNADTYIYTRENNETFPDVWISNKKFKNKTQLSQGIKQQEAFIWRKAELVSWQSFDGRLLEGILYKPDNFDSNYKYPMIVNFYERNSNNLHNYRMPEPNRSTIDYSMYLSDGYIIFNPDVRYRDGYPGKDCYDCVMSGINEIVSYGYIDTLCIGAQGHSWGGYQVAYLATRTDKFAAIESGAPVVNMFSAYGGIRWVSGRARSFQYEHTQSRLGGTPWSHPERYKENSPLFEMDKVNTPILIMHNDKDGHVPWYQGIEFFIALKRLGKTAWLLNYSNEPHWPMRHPNKMDFQIRMKQFFDHYLKGTPMPKWMKEGVPAVKQPYELGY